MNLGDNIKLEYTAMELKQRHEDYLLNCEEALKEREEKLRKRCKVLLKQLVSEFNRQAENEFDKQYVILSNTPIPPSLPFSKVIVLIRDMFAENGF